MTIRKGYFTFVFMFDDNIHSVDEVNQWPIDAILDECDTGHMLGQVQSPGDYHAEEIPNEKVADEEIALGCDGTFFADPDELEHARMDAEAAAEGDE